MNNQPKTKLHPKTNIIIFELITYTECDFSRLPFDY
jgi:hypothetical protein